MSLRIGRAIYRTNSDTPPSGARVGEHVARHRAETESVVEFPVGQQSGV